MHRLIRNIAVLLAILLSIWIHFGNPGVESAGAFNHDDISQSSSFLKILDNMPQHANGVPDDSAFGVLIESDYGIDTTDAQSIRFEINDGTHFPYQRDLSSDTMRVVLVEDEDPHKMLIWVIYDRSLEPQLPPLYMQDTIVRITVTVVDLLQHRLYPKQFWFKIEPNSGPTIDFETLPDYDFINREDLISDARYDAGMEIFSGELQGARILYNSDEPLTPGFGPVDEIGVVNLKDAQGVGLPLNLVPHTIFLTPVKVYIPFPPGTDIANMDIFYHNGVEWLRACDADGNVLPGGRGWMVAGSRVNHYITDPPKVEIQVYHFSAAQGGFVVVKSEDNSEDSSGTKVVVKCFIDTAADNGECNFGLLALLLIFGALGMLLLQFFRRNGFYLKKLYFRQD